jgi:hypothetical protein
MLPNISKTGDLSATIYERSRRRHAMNKITAERNQRAVLELAALPGNGEFLQFWFGQQKQTTLTDVCADCKARNPRWASWNLGIFIWCVF